MTDAERQVHCRAARAAGQSAVRIQRPADHRSRAKRWCDTVAASVQMPAECAAWLEALPEALQDTPTGEALHTICDFDLDELQVIVPP